MDKLKIALEVIDMLLKESKDGLDSEHYSVRCSSESKIESIKVVKLLIEDKLGCELVGCSSILDKIKETVESDYDSEACGYTSETSEGNYDDVFSDGLSRGRSDLAYSIGKLIGMELEEPEKPKYSWED